MSFRVAEELNLPPSVVSFQIRFQGTCSSETKIKFMTDGVLLRELREDALLKKYSCLVIDEAHERGLYTDILIGLLSRVILLRKEDPLKLIIMSATLRVEDFCSERLFVPRPLLIDIPSRQFSVKVYFARRTKEDYVKEAYKKVCRINKELPEGGILVFLSAQNEVWRLVRMLSETFPRDAQLETPSVLDKYDPVKTAEEIRDLTEPDADLADEEQSDSELVQELSNPMICLPLYSMLDSHLQQRVFQTPPPGVRLCIVSTNVAETSITLPNVKYVVDTGKEKRRGFDPVTGVSKFQTEWISRASASQRSGRAGRTAAGFAYRLYSRAVFSSFSEFPPAEMLCRPADDIVLQLKSMGVKNPERFPFPTPPDPQGLKEAELRLVRMGALEFEHKEDGRGYGCLLAAQGFYFPAGGVTKLTALGESIAQFPLAAPYAKMISLAQQKKELVPYCVALVAALSVREPLVNLASLKSASEDPQENVRKAASLLRVRRNWAKEGEALLLGDFSVLLNAVGAIEFAQYDSGFALQHGVRPESMGEIRKMRKQLSDLLRIAGEECWRMIRPPEEKEVRLLRELVLAGLSENVARRQSEKGGYRRMDMEEDLFIYPSSVLVRVCPEWVVYQEVIEGVQEKKFMFNVCAVEPDWLPVYARNYCEFNEPPKSPHGNKEEYDPETDRVCRLAKVVFGKVGWVLPSLSKVGCCVDTGYFVALAEAFLEGRVCTKLERFRERLLAAPSVLRTKWGLKQERSLKVVGALAREGIRGRKDLEGMWEREGMFLYEEYCEWVPKAMRGMVYEVWPPV